MDVLKLFLCLGLVLLVGCGKPRQVVMPPLEQGSIGLYAKVVRTSAPLADLTQEEGTRIVVTRLIPGSSADRAGIKPGDTILEIDGQGVNKASQAIHLMQNSEVGTSIPVKIKRGKESIVFNLEVEPYVRQPVELRKPQDAPDTRPEPKLPISKQVPGPVAPVEGGDRAAP